MAKDKTQPTVYKELLSKFDKYAERKAGLLNEAKSEKAILQKELAEIQKSIAENASIMSADECRAKQKRMDEVFNDLDFYSNRIDSLNEQSGVSKEEYSEWKNAAVNETQSIRDDCEKEVYKVLTELLKVCKKYNTEIIRMHVLRASFENAIGKSGVGDGASIPEYLNAINRILLVYYNQLDKAQTGGENVIDGCIERETVNGVLKDVLDVGKKVDYTSIGNINVLSVQDAIYAEQRANNR